MNSLIKFEDGALASASVDMITAIEAETASMIEKREEMRRQLKAAMEEHGIKKIDGTDFSVTYVESCDREVFDKGQFKEDMPEVYEGYVTMKPVSSSIRVKLK